MTMKYLSKVFITISAVTFLLRGMFMVFPKTEISSVVLEDFSFLHNGYSSGRYAGGAYRGGKTTFSLAHYKYQVQGNYYNGTSLSTGSLEESQKVSYVPFQPSISILSPELAFIFTAFFLVLGLGFKATNDWLKNIIASKL